MTKLCNTKCDHLRNFYISLEKRKKITMSLQQYDRSAQNLTWWRSAWLFKILMSKFPDIGQLPSWKSINGNILWWCRTVLSKRMSRPPSWILKIKFLSNDAYERHVQNYRTKFSGVSSYCWRDIAVSRIFLAKLKTHYMVVVSMA